MERILIASGKGGVGKSTLALCLTKALAKRKKRVLLVDCDVGLRSLDLLTGLGAYAVYSWLDLLEGGCTLSDALLSDTAAGFSFLTAPNRLDTSVDGASFSKMITAAGADFDFCILDAGAGLGELLPILAAAADFALLVATPDAVSARAAVAAAEALHASLPEEKMRLVLNRYTYRDVRSGAVLSADEMIDLTELRLLGAVPEDMHLRALSRGDEPEAVSAASFDRIAARILGENVPFSEKKMRSVRI